MLTVRTLLVLACLTIAHTDARAAAAPQHEDARLGISIKPPKDWIAAPPSAQEPWKVAAFVGPRAFLYNDPEGWTWQHTPQMVVVAFPTGDPAQRASSPVRGPHADYAAYLAASFPSHRSLSTKSGQHGELDVSKLEHSVASTGRNGPRQLHTWVYATDGHDIAVQFEVLEDAYPKLKRDLESCFKSFRLIERRSVAEASATKAELARDAWSELDVAERRSRREHQERVLHARALEQVSEGWKALEHGRLTVLHRSDEKRVRRIAAQVERVLAWLDAQFREVGQGEYVRAPVVRVCKDRDEQSALQSSVGYSTAWIEIVTCDDRDGFDTWNGQELNRQVLEFWFRERDDALYGSLPPWLRDGLSVMARSLVDSKGKLELRAPDWEREQVRDRARNGKLASAQQLVRSARSDIPTSDALDFGHDAGALVMYLAGPQAQRQARAKGLLAEYIAQLARVVDEIELEEKPARELAKKQREEREKAEREAAERGETLPKPPEPSPEQLEAERKAAQERFAARERRILDQSFERTFGAWTEKDWKELEKAFAAAID